MTAEPVDTDDPEAQKAVGRLIVRLVEANSDVDN